MTPLLAGLAGATTVAGLLLIAAGFTTRPDEPSAPRARAPRRGFVGGRFRWRWAGALAAGVLVWLVTGWPVAGILVAVAVVGLPLLLSTSKVAAARIDRVEAIEEWTRRLADVLITGIGLEQAITATAKSCPAPVRGEVGALLARLAARWPTDKALRAFADDLHDPAGDLVVAALLLAAHRRGPGLVNVLTGVAGSVAEDIAARRKIEAERARPRTTAKAVTLITVAVLAVGSLNGSYLEPYGNPLGQVVLAVLAGCFIGCLLWMRRLTLPPPDPRFLAREGDRS